MLDKWLAPLSLLDFERQVLGKNAWAGAAVAADEAMRFGWPELDQLLRSEPLPDTLVVARGQLLQAPEPRSLQALQALMRRGEGICVRRGEASHSVLTGIARSLESQLGTYVHVQVFATPGGTHGFGWHYDAEHVFIVQTAGVKDYYFRQNTVDARTPDGARPDFSRVRSERSVLQTARLLAGDCLYIPARWWHMARCVEDSLSMSLGVSTQRVTSRDSRRRAARLLLKPRDSA
jgi:hypothetical protein